MTIPSVRAAPGRRQRAGLLATAGPLVQRGARSLPVPRERRAVGDVVTDRHGEQWVELPKPVMGRRCLVREHLSTTTEPFWAPWREAELPIAAAALLVEVN